MSQIVNNGKELSQEKLDQALNELSTIGKDKENLGRSEGVYLKRKDLDVPIKIREVSKMSFEYKNSLEFKNVHYEIITIGNEQTVRILVQDLSNKFVTVYHFGSIIGKMVYVYHPEWVEDLKDVERMIKEVFPLLDDFFIKVEASSKYPNELKVEKCI